MFFTAALIDDETGGRVAVAGTRVCTTTCTTPIVHHLRLLQLFFRCAARVGNVPTPKDLEVQEVLEYLITAQSLRLIRAAAQEEASSYIGLLLLVVLYMVWLKRFLGKTHLKPVLSCFYGFAPMGNTGFVGFGHTSREAYTVERGRAGDDEPGDFGTTERRNMTSACHEHRIQSPVADEVRRRGGDACPS